MRKKGIICMLCLWVMLWAVGCQGETKEIKTPETAKEQEDVASDGTTTEIPGNGALIAIASEGLVTQIDCEPIELSLGCSGTVDGTAMGDAIYAAMEAAKDWTGGNFVINFYPGGQLGGDVELIEGTQMGSVDMFTGAPTSQVGLIPELAVLDIGGLYEDTDAANQVLDSFLPELQPYYNKAGLHLATMYAPNFRVLSSNKKIETASDLKGLNIRTQENKYHMAFWKELGTNPTPLAFGELYIALQQGMMDAQENPWASIVGAKLCEVQSYIVESNHIPFVTTFVVNQAKYDSMSQQQKLAFEQFIQFCKQYQLAATADDDARMAKLCQEDFGIEVTPVSDEIKGLYANASQVVITMLKEHIDPQFVDRYVEAAKAVAK